MVQYGSKNPAFSQRGPLPGAVLGICALLAVAALFWMAISMHRQTALRELEAHQQASEGLNDFLFNVASNAKLSDIYVRGKQNFDTLNPVEKTESVWSCRRCSIISAKAIDRGVPAY